MPQEVDPCGEFGEFHTFVFDGPLFKKQIEFELSKEVTNTIDHHTNTNRFCFIDLIPKNE
ncbi:hypothetical protein [Neobacillus niacini]|uniref:Dph6-related ATP pyrophosphatase n=1 Tax=Neobacillus niacini TaxID=86668 RepID=UPI00286AE561|nr:hypothetical protein [Neobacillus niacini]